MENKPYGTVLIKAEKIMSFLSERPNSTLQKIAQGTEITSSTTSKILETLVLIGFVKRNEKNKEYSLGTKFIRYANKGIEQIGLVEVARPLLTELRNEIDETIHLGIFSDDEVLYVDKLEPRHQVIFMSTKIGTMRPLYSSAMGKAILSELSFEEVQEYLGRTKLIPYTENTITNSLKLINELETVKQLHVALDDEEMEKEIYCFGSSIKSQGKVIGAFSISMPKYRLNEERRNKIIESLIETKKKIEQKL